MSQLRSIGIGLVLWISIPGPVSAHQPDTSYLKVEIGDDAILSRFTFDAVTLQQIVPDIDENGDGALSLGEAESAQPRVEAYLRERVFLDLDGVEAAWGESQALIWPHEDGGDITPEERHLLLVHFPFDLAIAARPEEILVTYDVFIELGTRHQVLAELLVDGAEKLPVVFRLDEPDYLLHVGAALEEAPKERVWHTLARFFRLGMEHIFAGYDHLLFLLALIVASRFRQVVAIVTAFTIGHTVTLILAATGTVSLPSRWVESGIALTIIYVAAENLWRGGSSGHRWLLAGFFGLVHGFGFAGILRQLGLPRDGLAGALLSFNIGVEVGQVLVVLALFPLLVLLDRSESAPRIKAILSMAILLFGVCWLFDRAFALDWMPI